jgi:RNA polymerase nonessential primary-like sigma factor
MDIELNDDLPDGDLDQDLTKQDSQSESNGFVDNTDSITFAAVVYNKERFACDAEHAYVREVSPIPLLSYEDELRLSRACREGDALSRQTMIKHNLRLVLSLARRYRNRGLALLDMVSEGNLGLM